MYISGHQKVKTTLTSVRKIYTCVDLAQFRAGTNKIYRQPNTVSLRSCKNILSTAKVYIEDPENSVHIET